MLRLVPDSDALRVLFLGAHCDDIEIGCGATVLRLARERGIAELHWAVFSAEAGRRAELEASFRDFVPARRGQLVCHEFRDGFFPAHHAEIKEAFEALKRSVGADLVFTHRAGDSHQDHRLVNELTWNTFRDHWILEYEIPKFEGDLGPMNFYSVVSDEDCERKIQLLLDHYASQRSKRWFDAETFRGIMRLRGVETGSTARYAEAFHCRKACF